MKYGIQEAGWKEPHVPDKNNAIECSPLTEAFRTSPSNGQATAISLLRHHKLPAFHSGAALDQAAARQIQQTKTTTKLSIFALSAPLQIRLPALQRCRLNTSYTPFEAVRAMEQALLPTIEANRKGNLKNERTYLL